jgi:outer membrane protein insertion porin family
MGRVRYGAMGGIYHGNQDIPYTDRFAPGGVDPDGTIRGYDDGLVGPFDKNGAFLRGRFELLYNLELTIPVSEQQFYVLLFADAGNAYLTRDDIHLTRGYVRSFGPGFRVLIPLVGIMGFDFGYALDSVNGSKKGVWKTHFQIGRGF